MHDSPRRAKLLDAAVSSFPDTGFILDRDGRYVEVLTGSETASLDVASPAALVGQQVHDVLPTATADDFLRVVRETLDSGSVLTHEYALDTPRGERWFEARVSPIRGENGATNGEEYVVWVARDSTDLRTELEAEERTAEAIIESLNDLFYLSDETGRLLEWNDYLTDTLGYTDEELASMTSADLLAETDTIDPDAALQRVFDEGQTETTVLIRTSEGETLPYSVHAHTFEHPEEGTVVCAVGRDISSIARYEDQLETRNHQLAILNRLLRHDIRNDMSVVLGWAELLDEGLTEPQTDYLRRILDSSRHVVELTDIARDLSASLENDSMPALQAVSLAEVLASEVEKRRETYDHATFLVDGSPDGDPRARLPAVRVEADELLASVFRNLMNNAVQHNDTPNPQVTVDVEVRDASVVVGIGDDGPGVPTDQKKTVFGEASKGLESVGSGMGLYLVDMLVERYGGQVWVEDNDPRGAVFNVELRLE